MDLETLRDEAKALGARKQQLGKEQRQLAAALDAAEAQGKELANQVALLGCANSAVSAPAPVPSDNPAAKRLLVKDAKLNLQLINAEIQSTIHRMELQAAEWARKAKQMEEKLQLLQSQVTSIPERYMQPTEELQASVDGMKQEVRRLTSVDPATAQAKQQLTRQINALQSELRTLTAQTDAVDSEIMRVRGDVDTQEAKCETLQSMHEQMKSKNATKESIHTWPHVAFVEAAGSADGRISIAECIRIITTYCSPHVVLSNVRVREVLAELYPSTASHIVAHGLTVDHFCAVVQAVDTPSITSSTS